MLVFSESTTVLVAFPILAAEGSTSVASADVKPAVAVETDEDDADVVVIVAALLVVVVYSGRPPSFSSRIGCAPAGILVAPTSSALPIGTSLLPIPTLVRGC